jgi:hypothetical protein
MKNLLILGLLLISILIYCFVKYNLKEGVINLDVLPELDLDSYIKERCEWQKKLKTKMTTTTCAVDDRCDHVKLGKVRKVEMGLDGRIQVKEEDNIKCEGFSNSKTETESQVFKCDNVKNCEDRGKNCGYCDDSNPPHGLGRFMWTTRGKEGPGNETVLNAIGQKSRTCPKNKWYYGENGPCIKARRQKLCGLIKSCDDFEKYSDIIDDGICGFCPTQGKAVPIEKIGDRNVPLYQPEDTCDGGPELEKYGTLNAKQCTKFMKDNPCVRPQYWTGSPDHSGECYKKLYTDKKYSVNGKDIKKDESWWTNNFKRRQFKVDKTSLQLGNNAPNNFTRNYAPIPWIITKFKEKATKINDKCYSAANNSWSWLTGYTLDACRHQDEKNIPNKVCQSRRWNDLDSQKQTGHARKVLDVKINDSCEGFSNIEGFKNGMDWLRKNIPEVLDKIEAKKWYEKKMIESKEKANIGGDTWKNFLKEIEGVMFGGKTYQMRVHATLLLKGAGYNPPPPPLMKKGDYVEYKLREHIFRGILWNKKGPDCKVMWDYYKNTSTKQEDFRGPTFGVCYDGTVSNPGNFNEGGCIEGIKGISYKDNKETCKNKRGLDKTSCEKPYGIKVISKGLQKSLFGYPQYPSTRAADGPGKLLGNYPRGIIKDVYLRVIKRCKPSSDGCSSRDYNCEDAMVIANKHYKKPQDCAFSMSDYRPCSRKCDGGWQYRDYKTILPAKGPDADKCPIGPNTKGYSTKFGWRRCNTEPCHADKHRQVKIRWCGKNGDDKNCIDPGIFQNGNSCIGLGARGRGPRYGMGANAWGTKGDEIQRGSCQDGGVSKNWRDSAGELLKNDAYFKLTPINSKKDVYTFKLWSNNSWSKIRKSSKRAGLKNEKGGEGLCLHPNVNTVEVKGGSFRWGRDQGWIGGPTNARNHNAGYKGGYCPWRPPRGFGQMYGPAIRYNRYGLNVTHVANTDTSDRNRGKESICYVRDGKWGKMVRINNETGGYVGHSARYINVKRRRWNWRRFRTETYYLSPNGRRGLRNWYRAGRRNGSNYRFRKGSRFGCNKGARYNKGVEWDGLGGLGSCNSKYAQLKMEKTSKGNFRLKREAFNNLNNNEEESSQSIWDYIVDFFTDKKACGYTKKDGNLKEGFYWTTKGSKRSQTPGKSYYMGEPSRGYFDATRDRLYANDKGSVHRFHCDMNHSTAEKRVGIFKCKGGRKNGKKYPFRSDTVLCKDKEPLVASGYKDSELHCERDCEDNGGKCEGPYKSLVYYKAKADPYYTRVHARNYRWWWSNSKSVLGDQTKGKTGTIIGGSGGRDQNPWRRRARPIPNIYTKTVRVKFYGRDQGWGNPTGWLRLLLWSGNRVVYNRDVGGRNCNGKQRCITRNWSWNNQYIPYWEFITRRPERITKALLVIREMGSGHQAWVSHASLEFNDEAKF